MTVRRGEERITETTATPFKRSSTDECGSGDGGKNETAAFLLHQSLKGDAFIYRIRLSGREGGHILSVSLGWLTSRRRDFDSIVDSIQKWIVEIYFSSPDPTVLAVVAIFQ